VLYLAIPIGSFVFRFAVGPARGFHAAGLFSSLWVSVCCATITLALVTVFGVPLAFVLARSKGRFASVVGLVVMIPLALPPLMSGLLLVYVVGPYTFLGRLFGGRLTDSMVGIVIAMTFCSAPFLIIAVRAAFESIDQGQLDVAATLGHSDVSRFVRVAVPMAGPSVRAGMLLTWLRAFGEYGAVIILAYNPASLPVYTYNQFSGRGLPTTLAPTALALVVAVVVVMVSRVRVAAPVRPITTPVREAPTALALVVAVVVVMVSRVRVAAPVRPITTPVREAPTPHTSHPVRFDVNLHVGTFHLALALNAGVRHLAILGPSGSGKSALLRCLAGLYGPESGSVWYGDEPVQDVAVEQRRVGYVAQGFALFPHLTVWRHLLFAQGATPGLAAYWLKRLRLDGLEERYPSELSGGQRQRVALAQALCQSPRLLLLDEPFSALDMPVRWELRRELRSLQRETGLATVIVTHDPEEAAFLSDEVIVLGHGRALQSGASRDVYSRPRSPEVAQLLGIANIHPATVVNDDWISAKGVPIAVRATGLAAGTEVLWSIRPEHVMVSPLEAVRLDSSFEDHSLVASLIDVADLGVAADLFLALGEDLVLQARVNGSNSYVIGTPCRVDLVSEAITVWPAATPLLVDVH
jgi:ABC-type Fe3+/spermidine/putrescine transport system ATPase subunit/ABC-type sulfate transport system permease component